MLKTFQVVRCVPGELSAYCQEASGRLIFRYIVSASYTMNETTVTEVVVANENNVDNLLRLPFSNDGELDLKFETVHPRTAIVGFASEALDVERPTDNSTRLVGVIFRDVGQKLELRSEFDQIRFIENKLTEKTRVTWHRGRCQVFNGDLLVMQFFTHPEFSLPYAGTFLLSGSELKVRVTVNHYPMNFSRLSPEPLTMEKLLKNEKFTDAVIMCGGQEFRVHRAVVASLSEVFDRMFSSGMQEGVSAMVDIEGASPEVVEAFIECMYVGKLPQKSLLPGLWHLANKYMIQDIAAAAMHAMINQMDASTASDCARVLRQHTAETDDSAEEMWSTMLATLCADRGMLRTMIEELALPVSRN